MTVRAGGKLGHRSEPWVWRLPVRKWGEAALAHRLGAINFGQIRLVPTPRAHGLRQQAGGMSDLMLDPETPLHEVRRMEFGVGNGREGDRKKTRRRVGQRGRAGELALRKS